MKYLKDKNTRRRGVAMEMAIMVLLVLTLLSTITVSAATILINKQSSTQKEFIEKIESYKYDGIGEQFLKLLSSKLYENTDAIETDLLTKITLIESEGLKIKVEKNPIEGFPNMNIYALEVYKDLNADQNIEEKNILLTVEVLEEKITLPSNSETEEPSEDENNGVESDESADAGVSDETTEDNTSQVVEDPDPSQSEGAVEGEETNSETVTYIYTIKSWEYQ